MQLGVSAEAERFALDEQVSEAALGDAAFFVVAADERGAALGGGVSRLELGERAHGLAQCSLELFGRSAEGVRDLRGDLALE